MTASTEESQPRAHLMGRVSELHAILAPALARHLDVDEFAHQARRRVPAGLLRRSRTTGFSAAKAYSPSPRRDADPARHHAVPRQTLVSLSDAMAACRAGQNVTLWSCME